MSALTSMQQETILKLVDEVVEKPVFDLDELSWGDSKKIMLLTDKLNKAGCDAAAQIPIFEELEPLIAGLTLSVPRSWLVKRAPDPWRLSQPGALNYLKRDRLMDLFQAVIDGITSKESATGE